MLLGLLPALQPHPPVRGRSDGEADRMDEAAAAVAAADNHVSHRRRARSGETEGQRQERDEDEARAAAHVNIIKKAAHRPTRAATAGLQPGQAATLASMNFLYSRCVRNRASNAGPIAATSRAGESEGGAFQPLSVYVSTQESISFRQTRSKQTDAP